jgi:hypothetical protein
MNAHIAAWLLVNVDIQGLDDLWLAAQELRASGLQLDHLCRVRDCIFPEHLNLVTAQENVARCMRS